VSKSAAVAKLGRLGIFLQKPVRVARPPKDPSERKFRPRRKSATIIPLRVPIGYQSLNIGILDLSEIHCREVTGTGDNGLAVYCGHPKIEGSSYCEIHTRINRKIISNAPAKS